MSVPSLLFSGEEDNEEFSLLNEIHHNQIQSLIDLHKIPDELWLTRKRIEAGVLEQKKQREMLTNIQERLAQCRLERTRNLKRIIERPRSQSPPSERLVPTIILPERPSTSQYRKQQNINNIEDALFITNKNLWEEEKEEHQTENQFRHFFILNFIKKFLKKGIV
uniref:Uncharacterized protein n=1 Tax=Meloidogyne incognita TaxID=6306 RepID=A0A914KSQ9_MELIC